MYRRLLWLLDLWIWISSIAFWEVETSGLCVASHLFDAEEVTSEVHGMIVEDRSCDYVFSQMEGEQKRTISLQHAGRISDKTRPHVGAD